MQEDLKLAERRQIILDLLNIENRVLVSGLSQRFGISEVTIRNDLAELENRGLLERIHGGAIPAKRSYYNMTLAERSQENVEKKKQIAIRIASKVDDGETLMMNAGTTTLLAAIELKKKRNLKVVTNSLSIAQAIEESEGNSAILLGGKVNAKYLFTYGPDALEQLKRYRADHLILSVDGVEPDSGISTYHYEESELDSLMIDRSNKVSVVADSSKIGLERFVGIATFNAIDTLVTNEGASESALRRISKLGLEVLLA